MRLLEGKVAVITGSGRGVGRGEALEFAAHGASVVVNAPGRSPRGEVEAQSSADQVVELITGRGGQAVANYADVGDWDGARSLVETAISAFGRLDVLVNNAGFNRRAPIVDLVEEDWDAVVRVHLKGTFACTHHAAQYWRSECEAGRRRPFAIVNTLSTSGLLPTLVGGSPYASAKAGVATFSVISSLELAEYGVRVNAVSPNAYTRLSASMSGRDDWRETEGTDDFSPQDPANPAPLVAWLASDEAAHVSGQVFWIGGGTIRHFHGWGVSAEVQKEGRWEATEIGQAIDTAVFASRAPRMNWQSAMQASVGHLVPTTWPPPGQVAPKAEPTA
jgi:NAD(P)-dependent dehydrogenase (short-subunit alcohol dehydrogenase family)